MPYRRTLVFLLLSLPLLSLNAADMPPAAPAALPYSVAGLVDLTRLLAPPPNRMEAHKELAELMRIQRNRTKADEAACVSDQVINVFRFADVLGSQFTPENLPKTNALFLRIIATVHVPLEKAQQYWTRKRPPLVDPDIKPVGMVPTTAAYPSGHATNGNLMGIILGDMVPERMAELHARGELFAYRRVLAGVHYPSDIEAGKVAAAAIAQNLFQDPQFQGDFSAARNELRTSLGLKTADGGTYSDKKDKDDDDDKGYAGKKEGDEAKEAKEY